MFDPGLMKALIILGIFAIMAIFTIAFISYWRFSKNDRCNYCGMLLGNCKITVTNDNGVKTYCSPECVDYGLRREVLSGAR